MSLRDLDYVTDILVAAHLIETAIAPCRATPKTSEVLETSEV